MTIEAGEVTTRPGACGTLDGPQPRRLPPPHDDIVRLSEKLVNGTSVVGTRVTARREESAGP